VLSTFITICVFRRYLQKSSHKPTDKQFPPVLKQGLRLTNRCAQQHWIKNASFTMGCQLWATLSLRLEISTGISQVTQSVVALTVLLKLKCFWSTVLRSNRLATCCSHNTLNLPITSRDRWKTTSSRFRNATAFQERDVQISSFDKNRSSLCKFAREQCNHEQHMQNNHLCIYVSQKTVSCFAVLDIAKFAMLVNNDVPLQSCHCMRLKQ